MRPPVPRLMTILAAIKERLPQDVITHVGAPRDANRNESPPRVVLAPVRGTSGSGGRAGALWVRSVSVEASLWGEDIGMCEELQVVVVNAARSAAAAAMDLGGETWHLGGINDRGVEMIFEMSFQIPIERRETITRFLPLDPMTTQLVTDLPLI